MKSKVIGMQNERYAWSSGRVSIEIWWTIINNEVGSMKEYWRNVMVLSGVEEDRRCVYVNWKRSKGYAPRQDWTTDLPLTKRVLYHWAIGAWMPYRYTSTIHNQTDNIHTHKHKHKHKHKLPNSHPFHPFTHTTRILLLHTHNQISSTYTVNHRRPNIDHTLTFISYTSPHILYNPTTSTAWGVQRRKHDFFTLRNINI